MKKVFIDIETLPAQPEAENKAEIAATITHPATMSKAETIQEWHNGVGKYEGVKDALIEAEYRKTSLNALYGSICSIAWAIDDGDIFNTAAIDSVSEGGALRYFFDSVLLSTDGNPFFVGHSIGGFDLKYLWQRAMILNVKPSFKIPFNGRHDQHFFCTMQAWAGYGQFVKMDTLAKAFGIEGKGDMDGSKVWDEWKAGNHSKVIDYNKDDVRIVREIYRRLSC